MMYSLMTSYENQFENGFKALGYLPQLAMELLGGGGPEPGFCLFSDLRRRPSRNHLAAMANDGTA